MNKSEKLGEKLRNQVKVEIIRKLKWQLSRGSFLQISNQLHLPMDFQIGGRLGAAIQIQLWNDFRNE